MSARQIAALVLVFAASSCGGGGGGTSDRGDPWGIVSVEVQSDPSAMEQITVTWTQVDVDAYDLQMAEDGVWGDIVRAAPGTYLTGDLSALPDATLLEFRARGIKGGTVGHWGPTTPFQFGVRPPTWVTITGDHTSLTYSWIRTALVADSLRLERAWIRADGSREARAPIPLPLDATGYVDADVSRWEDGRAPAFHPVYERRGIDSIVEDAVLPDHAPLFAPDVTVDHTDLVVDVHWVERSDSARTTVLDRTCWESGWAEFGPAWPTREFPPGEHATTDQLAPFQMCSYDLQALAMLASSPRVSASIFLPPAGLDPRFSSSLFQAKDSTLAAGSPQSGWVMAGQVFGDYPSTRYHVQLGASWQEGFFEGWGQTAVVARLEGGAAFVAFVTIRYTPDEVHELHVRRVDEGGESEVALAITGPVVRTLSSGDQVGTLKAATRGTVLHLAWTEADGVQHAQGDDAASREVVTCAGTADVVDLAVDPDGEPAILAQVGQGYVLARRQAGAWSCEPVPVASDTLGVGIVVPGSGTSALVVDAAAQYPDPMRLQVFERGPAGWGEPTLLASTDAIRFLRWIRAAASPAGRVAIVTAAWPDDPTGATGHVPLFTREPGESTWQADSLGSGNFEIGFGPDDKLWVLVGIAGDGSGDSEDRERPYGLLMER